MLNTCYSTYWKDWDSAVACHSPCVVLVYPHKSSRRRRRRKSAILSPAINWFWQVASPPSPASLSAVSKSKQFKLMPRPLFSLWTIIARRIRMCTGPSYVHRLLVQQMCTGILWMFWNTTFKTVRTILHVHSAQIQIVCWVINLII